MTAVLEAGKNEAKNVTMSTLNGRNFLEGHMSAKTMQHHWLINNFFFNFC